MTRQELVSVITEDASASQCHIPTTLWERIKFRLIPDYPLRYLVQLRYVEFLLSDHTSDIFHSLRTKVAQYRLRKMGRILSYEIHPFSFGPGLGLFHNGNTH